MFATSYKWNLLASQIDTLEMDLYAVEQGDLRIQATGGYSEEAVRMKERKTYSLELYSRFANACAMLSQRLHLRVNQLGLMYPEPILLEHGDHLGLNMILTVRADYYLTRNLSSIPDHKWLSRRKVQDSLYRTYNGTAFPQSDWINNAIRFHSSAINPYPSPGATYLGLLYVNVDADDLSVMVDPNRVSMIPMVKLKETFLTREEQQWMKELKYTDDPKAFATALKLRPRDPAKTGSPPQESKDVIRPVTANGSEHDEHVSKVGDTSETSSSGIASTNSAFTHIHDTREAALTNGTTLFANQDSNLDTSPQPTSKELAMKRRFRRQLRRSSRHLADIIGSYSDLTVGNLCRVPAQPLDVCVRCIDLTRKDAPGSAEESLELGEQNTTPSNSQVNQNIPFPNSNAGESRSLFRSRKRTSYAHIAYQVVSERIIQYDSINLYVFAVVSRRKSTPVFRPTPKGYHSSMLLLPLNMFEAMSAHIHRSRLSSLNATHSILNFLSMDRPDDNRHLAHHASNGENENEGDVEKGLFAKDATHSHALTWLRDALEFALEKKEKRNENLAGPTLIPLRSSVVGSASMNSLASHRSLRNVHFNIAGDRDGDRDRGVEMGAMRTRSQSSRFLDGDLKEEFENVEKIGQKYVADEKYSSFDDVNNLYYHHHVLDPVEERRSARNSGEQSGAASRTSKDGQLSMAALQKYDLVVNSDANTTAFDDDTSEPPTWGSVQSEAKAQISPPSPTPEEKLEQLNTEMKVEAEQQVQNSENEDERTKSPSKQGGRELKAGNAENKFDELKNVTPSNSPSPLPVNMTYGRTPSSERGGKNKKLAPLGTPSKQGSYSTLSMNSQTNAWGTSRHSSSTSDLIMNPPTIDD